MIHDGLGPARSIPRFDIGMLSLDALAVLELPPLLEIDFAPAEHARVRVP
jgi:hypothetical protein